MKKLFVREILCSGVFCIVYLFAAIDVYSQKIETVDGVRVVHNEKGGKWGKNPEVAIKLVRTIGDVDTEDENLAFNSPSDIAMDAAGNIYILDSGNQRIQKFSPEGKYLATIGRKGQGPGEFSSPASLDVDSKGYLYIFDPAQRRLQILTPEGKEFKTVLDVKQDLDKVRLLKSGRLAGQSRIKGNSDTKAEGSLSKLLKVLDLQMTILKEFGEAYDYKEQLTNMFGNFVLFEIDGQDNIYLSFIYQNRIEKYSPDGRLNWKADRALKYSTELIEKGRLEVTAASQKYTAPKMNRCSNGIAVDEKSREWIVTLNRQIRKEEEIIHYMSGNEAGVTKKTIGNTDLRTTDMYKLEIFSPDGVLLGVIPLNHFVDSIRIIGDNLFLLDRDRGVKYYQYKIIEK